MSARGRRRPQRPRASSKGAASGPDRRMPTHRQYGGGQQQQRQPTRSASRRVGHFRATPRRIGWPPPATPACGLLPCLDAPPGCAAALASRGSGTAGMRIRRAACLSKMDGGVHCTRKFERGPSPRPALHCCSRAWPWEPCRGQGHGWSRTTRTARTARTARKAVFGTTLGAPPRPYVTCARPSARPDLTYFWSTRKVPKVPRVRRAVRRQGTRRWRSCPQTPRPAQKGHTCFVKTFNLLPGMHSPRAPPRRMPAVGLEGVVQ